MIARRAPAAALALFVAAAAPAAEPPAVRISASAVAGLDLGAMDKSVPPDESFFRYANGTWLRTAEIPADRSSLGNFRILQDQVDRRVLHLIRGTAGSTDPDARRIDEYYASFMDAGTIERRGLAPLEPQRKRIAVIRDKHQLAAFLGSTLRADVDALNNTDLHTPNLLGVWVAQDLDDPRRYSAFLLQGGLVMPDREYYVGDAPGMAGIRDQYRAHIARVLELAGIEDRAVRVTRIYELERRIAQVHAPRADSSNVEKANNHWRAHEFPVNAPGLAWTDFFVAAGLAGQDQFVVWHPDAVKGIARLVAEEPLEAWQDWLTFHLIESAAPFLPSAFVDEHFAFHGKTLSGTPKLLERWKRGVEFTNAALGDAVGRLYANKHFPAADKARAEAMVRDIMAAFGKRIDSLQWMAPETKARAKAKLAVLRVSVGYPDTWRDYSGLDLTRGEAWGNQERAEFFRYRQSLKKLGAPVDRSEWVMVPQQVNAVNLPAMNAMNFPAAILQPPYFDAQRSAAMNYGAIGAIIGHEISHSFDDTGSLFDDAGKLQNWWLPADYALFAAAGERLVKQYDAYKPLPDVAVNGKLTLGENIADLAGIAAAYDGWQLSLRGQPAPVVQNLSGDQQFFLSFAQMWRSKYREPALRQRLITDGHSPGEFRASTVRNLDAWYAAFGVNQPGRALYLAPAERVRIW